MVSKKTKCAVATGIFMSSWTSVRRFATSWTTGGIIVSLPGFQTSKKCCPKIVGRLSPVWADDLMSFGSQRSFVTFWSYTDLRMNAHMAR